MKQTLIDKFKPEVKTLSDARFLQTALDILPDETLMGEVDPYSHPSVSTWLNNSVRLYYDSPHNPSYFGVFFPEDATNCRVNGPVCTFEYKGNKYQIN